MHKALLLTRLKIPTPSESIPTPKQQTAYSTRATWNEGEIRPFFDQLGKTLKYTCFDDWYSLTKQLMEKNGGAGLLASRFGNSVSAAVISTYPEHTWKVWKFRRVPRGYWSTVENQRDFFDSLFVELGQTSMDQWYAISKQIIVDHGAMLGGGMLESQFGNSPIRALMTVYPSHQWLVWKFERVPTNWWASAENQREYMDWLGTRLGVGEMVGWYRISQDDFEDNHGSALLYNHYSGSVASALKSVYPAHIWHRWKFSQTR